MYWYVLYVKTGRERKVEKFLKKRLNIESFVPLIELAFKKMGVVRKEYKPLFPGYIFIESEMLCCEFLTTITPVIYDLQDIIKILRYSDEEFAIRESEKQILMSLCNNSRYIESSSGIKVGNEIHIINGPLKGFESVVRKINRHKRQAWIEIEFMGEKRLICVSLEVVEKNQTKQMYSERK